MRRPRQFKGRSERPERPLSMPAELGSASLDLPDISKMPLKQVEPSLPEEYLEEENEMVGWLECFIEFN